MFEEFVIERVGLWHYMPFYRVGMFCVWDVLALAAIGLALFLRPHRTSRPDEATSSPR
jgi:anti-sigma-K factor RskA